MTPDRLLVSRDMRDSPQHVQAPGCRSQGRLSPVVRHGRRSLLRHQPRPPAPAPPEISRGRPRSRRATLPATTGEPAADVGRRARRNPGRWPGSQQSDSGVTHVATHVSHVATQDNGAPGGIRTPDHLIRSQMLYPLSYGRAVLCWFHAHFNIRSDATGGLAGQDV